MAVIALQAAEGKLLQMVLPQQGWGWTMLFYIVNVLFTPIVLTGLSSVGMAVWRREQVSIRLLSSWVRSMGQLVNAWVIGALQIMVMLLFGHTMLRAATQLVISIATARVQTLLVSLLMLPLTLVTIWVVIRFAIVHFVLLKKPDATIFELLAITWKATKGHVRESAHILITTEGLLVFIMTSLALVIRAYYPQLDMNLSSAVLQLIVQTLLYPYCVIARAGLAEKLGHPSQTLAMNAEKCYIGDG